MNATRVAVTADLLSMSIIPRIQGIDVEHAIRLFIVQTIYAVFSLNVPFLAFRITLWFGPFLHYSSVARQ